MSLNWLDFLTHNNIVFVNRGPNVVKGNVAIRCPWCGVADPSQHLNISPEGFGYFCLRNRAHKGRSPIRLIQALLQCSYEQARMIAGIEKTIPTDFLSQVQSQMQPLQQPITISRKLKLPDIFKPLRNSSPSAKPYLHYLATRHYPQAADMAKEFGLYYCSFGAFRGRVIFPVYYQKQLVSWTGRTIFPSEPLRYKSLTTDAEKAKNEGTPLAVGPIGHYLLWFDDLLKGGGETIVLCEGPMDALKVNFLGKSLGIKATCFFTNSPSDSQVDFLHQVLPKFKHRYLVLDQGTTDIALRVSGRLVSLNVKIKSMLPGVKDPGDLITTDQLVQLLK